MAYQKTSMIGQELLKERAVLFLSTQAYIAFVAFLLGIGSIGTMLILADIPYAVEWVVITISLELISLYLRRNTNKLFKTNESRVKFGMIANVVDALILTSSLLFIPFATTDQALLISGIIMMVVTGSPMTSAGYQPLLWSFCLPILISISIVFLYAYSLTSEVAYFIMAFLSLSALILIDRFASSIRQSQIAVFNAQIEAERANTSKTRFFISSTHDLRQPMAALGAFIQSAINLSENEKVQAQLENAQKAIDMMEEQLKPMSELARIDSGKLNINKTRVNLYDCVKEIVSVHISRLSDEVELHEHFEKNLDAWCLTDKALFERIVSNILDNAIKYTKNGSINIKLTSSPKSHTLVIVDTGQGIKKEELDLIFDEFYQEDQENSDGFGLGLSIVLRLCTALGIKIDCASVPNKYTEFTLNIPIDGVNRLKEQKQASGLV